MENCTVQIEKKNHQTQQWIYLLACHHLEQVIPSCPWPVCDLTTNSGQNLSGNSTYNPVIVIIGLQQDAQKPTSFC